MTSQVNNTNVNPPTGQTSAAAAGQTPPGQAGRFPPSPPSQTGSFDFDLKFNEKSPDFHLLEYQSLRTVITETIKEIRMIEVYCTIAAAAIWTWLATNNDKISMPIVWWIPVLIALLGMTTTFANYFSIDRHGRYLRKLEKKIRHPNLEGWENFLEKDKKGLRGVIFKSYSIIFWFLYLLAAIIVPFFLQPAFIIPTVLPPE